MIIIPKVTMIFKISVNYCTLNIFELESVHITTDIPPLFINFPKNKGGISTEKCIKFAGEFYPPVPLVQKRKPSGACGGL